MRALLDSPDTFLTRYHRHHTGITSWALARGRTATGHSSYELLASLVPGAFSHDVVDLGCGDGLLLELLLSRGVPAERIAGVDFSPDELSLASKRSNVADASLLCEDAGATSLAPASCEHVLSHLAFNYMSDPVAVVAEVARVLVPGGRFSAVVPGESTTGDAREIFARIFDEAYRGQATRAPTLGDPRSHDRDGLHQLLRPATGFSGLEIVDFDLSLDGSASEVWNSLSARYEAYVILPRDRAALRQQFIDEAAALARPDGTIPCTLGLRQFVCRRTSA